MSGQKKPHYEYDSIRVSESLAQIAYDDIGFKVLNIIGTANSDMLALLAACAKEHDPPNEIILVAVGSVCTSRLAEAGQAEVASLRATIDMCLPESQRSSQDGIPGV